MRHDGLDFDVVDTGPLDGEIVVLLHGFPQRASTWAGVSRHLHEHGQRTIALDQRGYSPGARPSGRASYARARLVGDVVALVGALGGSPVHLVGHDWGAAVAWWTAAGRPDLLRSLTTVSVPHPGAMARSMPYGQALASWYVGFFQLPWLPERVLSASGATRMLGLDRLEPAVGAAYRRDIVEDDALHTALGWYRALPFGGPAALSRRVRVPTTHVWSDRDPALIRRGAELTGDFVRAPYELVVLTGVSHWILDEAPQALAETIAARVASV